jgi:hypothetical protein
MQAGSVGGVGCRPGVFGSRSLIRSSVSESESVIIGLRPSRLLGPSSLGVLQRVAVNKKQPASRRGEFDFLLN